MRDVVAQPEKAITEVGAAEPGRRFSLVGRDPWSTVEWTRRSAEIRDAQGSMVFRQEGVEAPAGWSETAVRIVASKYFRGVPGSPERESSVRQLLGRVVETLGAWGEEDGYFSPQGGEVFRAELAHLLLEQRASFNSPVWFNLGVDDHPQCSACFILSVDDTMDSILELARSEGMLFKHGSGSGCNLSRLRSSEEPLATGGTASGPLPFMRGLDALAGAIKSGGRTRRAAKMVLLDGDHPDVLEFIAAKQGEEGKAQSLIAAGYGAAFALANGAYESVAFQNANHSVRLSDDFFRAVEAGGEWALRRVLDGSTAESLPASELLERIAEATWWCGDPGVQYASTIDAWHTCSASGPIRASNPCAEFLFLDDTACNLASLNLLRFFDPTGGFQAEDFAHACELLVMAQEILVDRARYPTAAITANSRAFRPLGLGYANLGALLLAAGLPYDSEEGRALAASVTALLTGAAYRASARLAASRGPFDAFDQNRQPALAVLARHRDSVGSVAPGESHRAVLEAARRAWDEAVALAEHHGLRNAQVTALAPTGTIAFMMDCDTTGVEPDLALVKRRRLVGGGELTLVNGAVPAALDRLGYDKGARERLLAWLSEEGTLEGAPDLAPQHLAVFDCALPVAPGGRSIAPMGHLRMLAALQPFVSGGISKTVNVPAETSPAAIAELYLEGWRLGLKALAIYRDGCKSGQPLAAGNGHQEGKAKANGSVGAGLVSARVGELEPPPPAAARRAPPQEATPVEATAAQAPRRRRLPDERPAVTHKFSVGHHEGYLTVGLYDDGSPGEIFLVMAKEGSTIAGLMDTLATTISLALQHGVPLRVLVEKLIHTRFEPSGITGNRAIPFARSVTDYIFRWLGQRFLEPEAVHELGIAPPRAPGGEDTSSQGERKAMAADPLGSLEAPLCHVCGALMVPSGSCHRCLECGTSSGCG
jgi:ribonucleoside-diphosphate reductase alpha chain